MATQAREAEQQSSSHEFEAEVSKLLKMMVHSVYSERDIFLRELISNAADACDRRRYEALTDPALGGSEPAITIRAHKALKTLTISDNGIGMSRQDLIDNLGTIARSGTQRFQEHLKAADGGSSLPQLIGQFGVGFYSAFMVADQVEVVSRRAGSDEAHRWSSDGGGRFAVAQAEREEAGTTITLFLKDDSAEFLDEPRISQIVRTYSDHIGFPIRFADGDGEPHALNSAKALWTRPKSEISDQEHAEFYRHVAGAWDEPLHTLHFTAEGKLEYRCLLYTPGAPPFDLFDPARESKVKLYVRRVFITDDCKALLPPWLRFLRGVVDAEDLSLNISREMLQKEPVLAAMKRAITGRVLADYQKLAEKEPETFTKLWEMFGRVLKEGIYEDHERRDELLKLARFRSILSDGWLSLADYKAKMADGQEAIHYLTGERDAKASPHIEGYRAKGIDVLLLSDPVDEFWLSVVTAFEDVPFRSVTRAGDKGDEAEADPAMDRLIAAFKSALGNAVSDVRPTGRLTTSAACIAAGEGAMDIGLQRMMRAAGQIIPEGRPVLQLNPGHPLVKRLAEKAGTEAGRDFVNDAAHLLLDEARLLDGEPLADPAGFAERLNRLLLGAV